MRFVNFPVRPFTVRLDDLGDSIAAEEEKPSPYLADSFNSEIFDLIKPGTERACIILRTEELTYSQIGWVLGIEPKKIAQIIYRVRNRFIKQKNLKNGKV